MCFLFQKGVYYYPERYYYGEYRYECNTVVLSLFKVVVIAFTFVNGQIPSHSMQGTEMALRRELKNETDP